jgi:hypothetical protein
VDHQPGKDSQANKVTATTTTKTRTIATQTLKYKTPSTKRRNKLRLQKHVAHLQQQKSPDQAITPTSPMLSPTPVQQAVASTPSSKPATLDISQEQALSPDIPQESRVHTQNSIQEQPNRTRSISPMSPPGIETSSDRYFPVSIVPSADFLNELGIPDGVSIPPDLITNIDICSDMLICLLADTVAEQQGLREDLDLYIDTGQYLHLLDPSYPVGYYTLQPPVTLVYDWCQHK